MDALVKVTRRSGVEQWVLVHVEVQSQVDHDFGLRMSVYHARIRDRYGRDVCSLAILGDENARWRPRSFVSELWGCKQRLCFPVKKLLDFPKTARKPHNPFSWLVAAHRQAQATKSDPMARKAIKFRLVRGLICDSGLTRDEISKDIPPTLLIHAQDDPVDPVHYSEVYFKALKKAGVSVTLKTYEHGGHAFGV